MSAKFPDYTQSDNLVSNTGVLADVGGTPTQVTGLSLATAKPIAVAVVDATGAQVTSFGGGGAGGGLTDAQLRATPVPVSASTLPLPTGAATLAAQTQPGVDIGDVTINNAGGAAAVNVQDGGNSLTVDGSITVGNAAGASAVNIQDGGNSITVDGTVTTSPPANASTNVAQLAGTTTSVNSGLKDAGTLRVVLATDQPALTNKLLVTPDSVALPANQSVNVNQFGGSAVTTGVGASGAGIPRVTVSNDSSIKITDGTTVAAIIAATTALKTDKSSVAGTAIVASVAGIQDVMPRKRTGSTGLSPNYTANRITSNTTTTPTAATAYVQSIVIACSGAGTSWTIKVQNKEATPKILVPALTLTVPSTGPIAIQFTEPVLMTSGIDIVTAGTAAGTVDVFVTYWQ